MKFLSLFSGAGGMDLGLEKGGMVCVGQVEILNYALKVLKKHWPKVPKHTDISTLLREDSLVKTFQSLAAEKASPENEADYSLSLSDLLDYLNRNGYCLKMFPDCYRQTKGKTWPSSSMKWPKAATGGLTEYWTVNTSEWPKDAVVCSLSEVLETDVPDKYYLSRKAVEGIIRRSWRDGRNAYVLLQEMGKDKTPLLKRLSLRQLQLVKVELKDDLGRVITLRELTPTEKEKLQGFPKDWTLIEDCY